MNMLPITRKMLSAFAVLMVFILMNFVTISGIAQTSSTADSPFIEVARLGRGMIADASWKSDGNAFLVNSDQGLRIYNTDLEDIAYLEQARLAAFSPDGAWIAGIHKDRTELLVWDTDNYQLVRTLGLTSEALHLNEVSLAWSPDSRHIALGFEDTLKIYDVLLREIELTLTFSAGIYDLEWSPDGEELAVANYLTLEIVDMDDGRITHTVSGEGGVGVLRWSPDGQTLARLIPLLGLVHPGSQRNALRLIDTTTYQLRLVIQTSWAMTVEWTPDGKALVSEHHFEDLFNNPRHTLRLWDAKTGEILPPLLSELPEFDVYKTILSMKWNPEGDTLMVASQDNIVRFYDWPMTLSLEKPSQVLFQYSGDINNIAWSPDGTQIASISTDSIVRIWDVATRQQTQYFQLTVAIGWDVAWSPDGSQLAFTDGAVITVIDLESGEVITNLVGDIATVWIVNHAIRAVAWSPDGRLLASGDSARIGRVWDMQTLQQVKAFENLPNRVFSLDWSADSERLAYTADHTWVWNVSDDNNDQLPFTCDSEKTHRAALSPDGSLIAVKGEGVCIWNIEQHRMIARLAVTAEEIDWHPDGTRIAVQTLTVATNETQFQIWDVASLERLAFTETEGRLRSIAWSPDGLSLATADNSGMISIWQQDS
jgi:WD40 repeat protein